MIVPQQMSDAPHEVAMNHQIDHVARAFYDAGDDAQVWESEPEYIKEEFREYARQAIDLLELQRKAGSAPDQAPKPRSGMRSVSSLRRPLNAFPAPSSSLM